MCTFGLTSAVDEETFLHSIFLVLLLKISWLYDRGLISDSVCYIVAFGLCIFSLCQYNAVLVTTVFKAVTVMLPASSTLLLCLFQVFYGSI